MAKSKTINSPYINGKFNKRILSAFHAPTKEQADSVFSYYQYNTGRDKKISAISGALALVIGLLFVLVALSAWNEHAEPARVIVAALGIGSVAIAILFFRWHSSSAKQLLVIQKQNYTVLEGKVVNFRKPQNYTAPGTVEVLVETDLGISPNAWFLVRKEGVDIGTTVLLANIAFTKNSIDFRAFTPHMFTKQGMRELINDSPMNPAI